MKNNLSDNEQKVLDHLKKDNLTTLEAVKKYSILHLGDVIYRLRRYGYNIQKEYKTSENKKRFAIYYFNTLI